MGFLGKLFGKKNHAEEEPSLSDASGEEILGGDEEELAESEDVEMFVEEEFEELCDEDFDDLDEEELTAFMSASSADGDAEAVEEGFEEEFEEEAEEEDEEEAEEEAEEEIAEESEEESEEEAEEEPEEEPEEEAEPAETEESRRAEKKSFWTRVKEGLSKTKSALFGSIDDLLKNFVKVDEDLLEELEEVLICADVGVNATEEIIEELRDRIKSGRLKEKEQVTEALREILEGMIGEGGELVLETTPSVILVIGVNGVGKTTSIGKIANRLRKQGKRVVVAAADTFRAAAIDQLAVWCDRARVELVRQNEGSDPAAVVFDACHAAKNKHADVLIIDTAGRLHNKTNLMNELAKINRVIDRELPGASRENLLVLDATTGQNAILQAKEFKNAAALTGLILNKMDGTAKGGIVISIRRELSIPVKFIGVGERLDDMQEFDQHEFVTALFE